MYETATSELETGVEVKPGVTTTARDADRLRRLGAVVDEAAHLLPAQGPITVFIHHNTLHALEHLPFEEAVEQGSRWFGCQPYLSLERYRNERAAGRIRDDDLTAVVRQELGSAADELVMADCTRLQLRLAMLRYPMHQAAAAELRWFVAESDALDRCRGDAPAELRERLVRVTRRWVLDELLPARRVAAPKLPAGPDRRVHEALADVFDWCGAETVADWTAAQWEMFALRALWRAAREGVHGVALPRPTPAAPRRHRDLLLAATGEDSDRLVHDLLVRFCAAFLDQGLSGCPLPQRQRGYFRAFVALYRQPFGPPDAWLRGLTAELRRIESAGLNSLDCALESLDLLGVPEQQWREYVSDMLLGLRGWAGMLREVAQRGDRVAHPIPSDSLTDYLAVALILDRMALAHVARHTLGYRGPLRHLRHALRKQVHKPAGDPVEQRAFRVFQLAQVLGWLPGELFGLSKEAWNRLVAEIEAFSNHERRRVYHLAYERRYRVQVLDALAAASDSQLRRAAPPWTRFQAVCCIDEREESFRRHLEESSVELQTFGAAGFFNVAMYYRGATESHFVPLCPIVVRPQHWVEERVADPLIDEHQRRQATRRALAGAQHQFHLGSRAATGGALLAAGLGVLATIPLVARVLFPRLTARLLHQAGRIMAPPRQTQLQLERREDEPGDTNGHLGYSLEEMATVAERLLRDIGLTDNFARLVVIFGHGSSSLNNPHNSAYNCGACGGSAGGANARAAAEMLNDPRVRRRLAERGLVVPKETVFVGALHNTCSDLVTWFDLERLPESHADEFLELRKLVDEARRRNAHERCRRFESAPLEMTFDAALRHVEARAEDLAQTRPECGHATNAVCLVGRRERSRGLFMDRRTFLVSYDPLQDDRQGTILTRLLQAALPVCAGINLEYYFSYVDPTGWGCGTKLPHNVSALLGVMDGAASDLRTGLPWQMVEIHEPVRLLFVVETFAEVLLGILDQHPALARLFSNRWVQLAVLSPDDARLQWYDGRQFQPYRPEQTALPRVANSLEWYRGRREHLGFALVDESCRNRNR